MLSPKGKLIGDFTVSCIREGLFQLTASYGSQAYHQRWFDSKYGARRHAAKTSPISARAFRSPDLKRAEVLQSCTTVNVADIKFLDVHRAHGSARQPVSCSRSAIRVIMALSYIAIPMAQRRFGTRSGQAGKPHGMTPFGMRAMMSLRWIGSFGSWLSEFSPDYTAAETGLDRFISFRKTC